MASRRIFIFFLLSSLAVSLSLSSTGTRAVSIGNSDVDRFTVQEAGQALALDGCDAIVANITDLCRDFVVGDAPPSPGSGSPCCKTLRGNRSNLSCLCGRVDFAKLNQKNLILTSILCAVPFSFEKCPPK